MIRTTVTVAKSITIHATPVQVWEMLAADRLMEWQPYMAKSKTFEYITPVESEDDKYKVGTTALFYSSCHHEIIKSVKFEKLAYKKYEETFLGTLGGTMTFNIKSTGQGVRFDYITRFNVPNGWKGLCMNNVFTRIWLEKQIDKETRKLKKILE